MRVVDLQEMKDIERIAIKEYNFNESLIIENVGLRGADFLEGAFLQDQEFGEIVVLVGQGNNGADGLAIARHLRNRGHRVRAFVLFPGHEKTSAEMKAQLEMAQAYGVKVSEVEEIDYLTAYFTQTQDEYFVIDAVVGTGFRGPLSNYLFEVTKIVNTYASLMVAIDIPTGVEGETGAVSPEAMKADYTLAIGLPKTGHYVGDGSKYCGEVVILDVGFPKNILEGGDKHLLTPDKMMDLYEGRNKFGHKNNFGHTLVVGGSRGLTGALIMASMAALKVGTGLVSASTWEESYPELCSRVMPEIMTGTIPTESNEVESIKRELGRYDSIIIGPGLGRGERARFTVLEILKHFRGPVVVDADAIKVLSLKEDADLIRSRKAPTVLTPHVGEFAAFVDAPKKEIMANPIEHLKALVDQTNSCVILKGACTYLGFPSGDLFINYFPNDGMATGGTGDVLAGILGGLLAQRGPTVDKKQSSIFTDRGHFYQALCLGVCAHSLAGKYAAEKIGVRAMTALSIVDHLSDAFKEFESQI